MSSYYTVVRIHLGLQDNLHSDIPTTVFVVDLSLLHTCTQQHVGAKGANYGFYCYVIIYIFYVIIYMLVCLNNLLGS
jgi:hypothetical protein